MVLYVPQCIKQTTHLLEKLAGEQLKVVLVSVMQDDQDIPVRIECKGFQDPCILGQNEDDLHVGKYLEGVALCLRWALACLLGTLG